MNATPTTPTTEAPWFSIVTKQVRSLRFGVVQIVVHDGRVVQIERTEKVRLNEPAGPTIHPAEGI